MRPPFFPSLLPRIRATLVATTTFLAPAAAAGSDGGDSGSQTDDAPKRWITHRVSSRDSLSSLEKRYEVTREELSDWNPWLLQSEGRLKRGRVLQLKTKRPGPKRGTAPRKAPVRKNKHSGTFHSLTPMGLSVGLPHAGHLVGGVPLPKTELYNLTYSGIAYGSRHAVQQVVRAVSHFRHTTKWRGQLTITSMSLRNGGYFPPHRSHQTGRDVDIRMPLTDGSGKRGTPDEIDWEATWDLVASFLRTRQTERIFLSQHLHVRLEQAARKRGASESELAAIGTIVRHSDGHDAHIHVRLTCGPTESRCRSTVGRPQVSVRGADPLI